MTYKSDLELQQIVETVSLRFKDLDRQEKKWHAIEDGSFDYRSEIPSNLGIPVVVATRRSTRAVELLKSAINWPLRPRVSIPHEGGKNQENQDHLEAFFGHHLDRADPRGIHKARIVDHMVRSRFAPLWLSVRPRHVPPQRKGENEKAYQYRVDEYDASYWRWGYEALNPESVGFLDRNGEVTTGTVSEEIPVVDLMTRLHRVKDGESPDDARPLTVLNKEFPWLRGTDGHSLHSSKGDSDFLNETVKLHIVDDGTNIYYTVEHAGGKAADGKKSFKSLEQEVLPNTFGVPSLIIFTGRYRPNALMSARYEAIAAPLFETERDWNLTTSILQTIGSNKRWAMPDPEGTEGRRDASKEGAPDIPFYDDKGNPVIPRLAAELQDVSNVALPEMIRTREELEKGWDYLTANLQLLLPTPESVKEGTAAAVLYGGEAALRPHNESNASISTGFAMICKMIAHDIIHGLNRHQLTEGPLEGHDKNIEFIASGTEATFKQLSIGQKYTLKPELFRTGFDVRIEISASTAAQRAAQVQMEMSKLLAPIPMTTPEKVLEADGEADVTAKLHDIAEFQRYQSTALFRQNAAVADAIHEIALVEERDENELIRLAAPQLQEVPMGGEGPQSPSGTQTIAPSQPLPSIGGGGT